jgi:hypothetical protein
MRIPLGDVVLEIGLRIPALHPPCLFWRVGPVEHARSGDIAGPSCITTRKVPPTMSFTIQDNEKCSFSVSGVDEEKNPVPLTGTPVYSIDDSGVLSLVDNGDGSCVVSATGTVGSGMLTVNDSETDGDVFIGSLAIDVIAGPVAAVVITPGTPEHV